jgi:nicotinamidase-related amidase
VVHLCIDVQKGCLEQVTYGVLWWDSMRSNIRSLAGELTKRNVPTIYVAFAHSFKGEVAEVAKMSAHNRLFLQKWPEAEIDFPLQSSDFIAFKTGYSARQEEAIAEHLKAMQASTVILSGLSEDGFYNGQIDPKFCVTQTAIDFRKAGYDVVIAAEATDQGTFAENKLTGYLDFKHRENWHNRFGVAVQPIKQILSDLDQAQPSFQAAMHSLSFVPI